jgi:hypothetical protein
MGSFLSAAASITRFAHAINATQQYYQRQKDRWFDGHMLHLGVAVRRLVSNSATMQTTSLRGVSHAKASKPHHSALWLAYLLEVLLTAGLGASMVLESRLSQ